MTRRQLRRRLARIAGVACDVDGVLTNGGLWFGPRGLPLKRFHVHDGMAIRLLAQARIAVAFISGDDSPSNLNRARRVGVRDVFLDVEDKAAALRAWAARRRLQLEQIAYIGDDINDIPAMQLAGLAVAVASARPQVRRAADLVTRAPGGTGALREVADLILQARA